MQNKLPLQCDWLSIISFCSIHGKPGNHEDERRKTDFSRSVDIGVKPGLTTYGGRYFTSASNHTQSMLDKAKQSLANIVDSVWLVGNQIQKELNLPPLGSNFLRRKSIGAVIQSMLGCNYSEFESVTVVHNVLLQGDGNGNCSPHINRLNNNLYSYAKTLAFNVILYDNNSEVYHFIQVICNFQKGASTVTERLHNTDISYIRNNISVYLSQLQNNYSSLFNACIHS